MFECSEDIAKPFECCLVAAQPEEVHLLDYEGETRRGEEGRGGEEERKRRGDLFER